MGVPLGKIVFLSNNICLYYNIEDIVMGFYHNSKTSVIVHSSGELTVILNLHFLKNQFILANNIQGMD